MTKRKQSFVVLIITVVLLACMLVGCANKQNAQADDSTNDLIEANIGRLYSEFSIDGQTVDLDNVVTDFSYGWSRDWYRDIYGRCSECRDSDKFNEKTGDQKVYIHYECDCNSLGVIAAADGKTPDLISNTNGKVSKYYLRFFDALGTGYSLLTKQLGTLDTQNVSYVNGTEAEETYMQLFYSARDLFDGAKATHACNLPLYSMDGAYIGLNEPFVVRSGEDSGYSILDYQTMVAGLFGIKDADTLSNYANILANVYKEQADLTSDNRLQFNGAVRTENGLMILPYLFNCYGGEFTFIGYLIVDGDTVSIWLSDVNAAMSLLNTDTVIDLDIQGLCPLFKTYAKKDVTPMSGEVYLYNTADTSNKYFIGESDDNYMADKYGCDVICNPRTHTLHVEYDFTKTICIPKELFVGETGSIYFSATGMIIYYKVTGNEVYLSSECFL